MPRRRETEARPEVLPKSVGKTDENRRPCVFIVRIRPPEPGAEGYKLGIRDPYAGISASSGIIYFHQARKEGRKEKLLAYFHLMEL